MKILVVDDDKNIAKFLKTSLENECFEVDIKNDGESGSFAARTNGYDLIILDYSLPGKNGQTICEEIRKDQINTPVIILSVQGEPHTKADLLNSGADDYLSKPFSLEELLARMRALLRRSNDLKQDILSIDNLSVDTKKNLVKRGNKEIYLTLKEFMLLEYLLRNQGAVLSRGLILEHVWDMNADLFSNTIEAHVSNVRRKIDLPGMKRLIQTVPGRGYKIDIAK
ncbi:MAG: response regulator transcription factor [Patescibacteria group bacterium]|nr:response regulator transcription factor [Patescibacteria group bacterium]